MNGTAELKTERLLLRRHRMEDAEILYRNFGSDEEMYAYSGWNPYETPEKAEETVHRFISSYDQPDFYGWAIEKDGKLIGTIGAYDYDPGKNCIEAGFSIERASWNHGYATEALKCVLDYLMEHEGIRTVTAWCAADNTGSKRTLENAGMKQLRVNKDGLHVNERTYDQLIYAIRKETADSEK